MDDSSTGFNAFVGTLNNGNPQELDNLRAEWSVSANDATNRFALAAVLQLPVGRGYLIGSNMNRGLGRRGRGMAAHHADHFSQTGRADRTSS